MSRLANCDGRRESQLAVGAGMPLLRELGESGQGCPSYGSWGSRGKDAPPTGVGGVGARMPLLRDGEMGVGEAFGHHGCLAERNTGGH